MRVGDYVRFLDGTNRKGFIRKISKNFDIRMNWDYFLYWVEVDGDPTDDGLFAKYDREIEVINASERS